MLEKDARSIDSLAGILTGAGVDPYIGGLVEAAKQHLGLDIAYVSEFVDGHQVFEVVDGDGSSFGIQAGVSVPLPETYCQRMLTGDIPMLIADTKQDELVGDLAATASSDIGAYVGIPIHLSDGQLYGTFCSISHSPAQHLQERDLNFMHVLARLVASYVERQRAVEENARLQTEAAGMGALVAALEARDGYTGAHSSAVLDLCESVAEVLGVQEPQLGVVKQVALLHDIGKVGIPDNILRKAGPLSDEEWAVMKTHPRIGRTILEATPSLAHLAPVVGSEHERWDGKGYPAGLKGDGIPLESRIVLACDAWHAMTSDRPYRQALSPDAATQQLERGSGTQFDPRVVEALLFLLRSQSTETALRRHRHDMNNLAHLIQFERYLEDSETERAEFKLSVAAKRASLLLPVAEEG